MAQRKVNCEVYTDRGIVGKEGADGKSAYQQAVEGGYQGTEEEFEQALASDIATVADNVTNINAVGNNIENVNTAVDNMAAIIAAPTAATQAAASASQAATSATNAQTSETNSATSASNAAESATNASASATVATTKASEATSSATSASASANSASASATSASINAENAEIWAEGTDSKVTTLGGEHSSKGWANISKQYVESIGAALKYKGSVSTYSDLPSTGQQNGDVWNVLDTGANYAWTGTEWDKLSETVDLSGYYTKTEVDTFISEQETNITTVQNDLAGLGDQVSVIESKIPAEASETNQLADKNYVDNNIPQGVYTQSNLLAGKDIEIIDEPVEGGIDEHTLACWHFDGNVINLGTDQDFTINTEIASYDTLHKQFGESSIAPSAYIKVPSTKVYVNPLTFDFWCRVTNAYWGPFESSYLPEKVGFQRSGNSLVVNRNGSVIITCTTNISDSNFHHYAIVYTLNDISVYIDGILQGKYDRIVQDISITNDRFLGPNNIDELRISDIARPLTPDGKFPVPTKPYSIAEPTGNKVVNNTITKTSQLINDSGFITNVPVATASSLGGVKPDGNTITVTEDGTISATQQDLSGYAKTADLATVATSGMYSDLTGIPGAATADTLGLVKPDGNTITVTEDGTISATGGSGSGFDFEGTKAEFDAAVAAGTITEDSVSLITDDVSGDNVATKAELQNKVSKSGDTMSGDLKMSGVRAIRFGVDGNHYYVQNNAAGNLNIYHSTGAGRGLQLNATDNYAPYYKKSDNKFYRLLTTADLPSSAGSKIQGAVNYSAQVSITSPFTCPTGGAIGFRCPAGDWNTLDLKINNIQVFYRDGGEYRGASQSMFATVSAGDVISWTGAPSASLFWPAK